jgi:hypothetical protein
VTMCPSLVSRCAIEPRRWLFQPCPARRDMNFSCAVLLGLHSRFVCPA